MELIKISENKVFNWNSEGELPLIISSEFSKTESEAF